MTNVLITGGTGTLGHALVPLILERGDQPIVFSRDEFKQAQMAQEFPDCQFMLGDVREYQSLYAAIRGWECDQVIHAAALKRIDTGERFPQELVSTNIHGTHNVSLAIRTVQDEGKDVRAVLVSSDKAVYPINTYGMTKAIAEKIFLGAGLGVVRYGNVLGSRGSLLEVIDRCVADGKPIPVTDRRMTRFWWSVEDAAQFVLEALDSNLPVGKGEHGWVHIPALQGRPVVDVIEEQAPGHPTVDIGIRPGEKLHEWLETLEENPNAKPSGGEGSSELLAYPHRKPQFVDHGGTIDA